MKQLRVIFCFLILMLLIIAIPGARAQHFHTSWEGQQPFSPMTIFVIGARLNGQDLGINDEIGIFDGDQCVGAGVLTGAISQSDFLEIIASKNDGMSGVGFTEGNTIIFKLWDVSANKEFLLDSSEVQFYDLSANPVDPVPFTGLGTTVVSLNGSAEQEFYYHVKKLPDNISPPVIDGEINEFFWSLVEADTLKFGGTPGDWRTEWGNWTDNLVTWKAVWSSVTNKLYAAITIIDDIPGTYDNNIPGEPSFQPWNDECLEFFVNSNNEGGIYQGSYDKAQQWFVTGENKIVLDDFPNSSQFNLYTGSDLITAISGGAGGNWSCEAEFNIYNTFPTLRKTLAVGDTIGWETWYDDSDNQGFENNKYVRDHQVGWQYTGAADTNADYFGNIVLDSELPHIIVNSPNGGENWQVGSPQIINWTSHNVSGNVKIEISWDAGISWTTIVSSTVNTGSYPWTPTAAFISNNCLVKIISLTDSNIFDISDSTFIISGFDIKGRLGYYSNSTIAVKDATIQLSGAATQDYISDVNGNYEFLSLASGNYTVTPEKNNDENDAISPYDASMILRYEVGSLTLSPYQKIAGDVSANGEVTSYDASYILRYCVGIVTTFPVGMDWTYVPHDFPIDDSNWSTSPRSRSYTPLQSDQLGQDFMSILYGDVSGNWQGAIESGSSVTVDLEIGNIQQTGDGNWQVLLDIKFLNIAYSGSFNILFDEINLQCESASIADTATNTILATVASAGKASFAFASGQSFYNQALEIKILFKALTAITPSNSDFIIENLIIDDNDAIISAVKNNSTSEIPTEWYLSQNQPNPFNSETIISYQVPRASHVIIEIYNLLGQRMRTLINEEKNPGTYNATWNGKDDWGRLIGSGIYIYKMRAGKFTAIKKMVLVQ